MQTIHEIQKLMNEVHANHVELPNIIIESKSIQKIPSFLIERQFKNIVIVFDQHTEKAAGQKIEESLSKNGLHITSVKLKQNKHQQVLADEQTIMQLFVEIPKGTDVMLAVGSGTIHDIVRFVSDQIHVPFISVPT